MFFKEQLPERILVEIVVRGVDVGGVGGGVGGSGGVSGVGGGVGGGIGGVGGGVDCIVNEADVSGRKSPAKHGFFTRSKLCRALNEWDERLSKNQNKWLAHCAPHRRLRPARTLRTTEHAKPSTALRKSAQRTS